MKNLSQILLFLTVFLGITNGICAQDENPEIHPSMILKSTTSDSIYAENIDYEGNAPALLIMKANAENDEDYSSTYEWIITRAATSTDESQIVLDRYLDDDEETEFTFNESGTFYVVCCAKFINGNDTIEYDEQWNIDYDKRRKYSFYESQLTMPNAFAPNGTSHYKPKAYKSIIEFHATIYNRWGQKLYSWDNIEGEGWDGTYRGHQVKDGVYYCLVHAKGADGRNFTIRKDVNILHNYIEGTSSDN